MERLSAGCAELVDAPERVIEVTLRAAVAVHRELGPGLAEKVYEAALVMELEEMGLRVASQVPVPVMYKGRDLGVGFRADLVVEDCLLLELKAVDTLADVHLAQTLNYLHLLGLKRGFILNFNTKLMKEGIQRVSI
jgi:GxxExxY protein